jgi:hypothetical protein
MDRVAGSLSSAAGVSAFSNRANPATAASAMSAAHWVERREQAHGNMDL